MPIYRYLWSRKMWKWINCKWHHTSRKGVMAMNPLKEMIPSNKKGRRWCVLNKNGEWMVTGSMNEFTLRKVFAKRL